MEVSAQELRIRKTALMRVFNAVKSTKEQLEYPYAGGCKISWQIAAVKAAKELALLPPNSLSAKAVKAIRGELLIKISGRIQYAHDVSEPVTKHDLVVECAEALRLYDRVLHRGMPKPQQN